MYTHTHIYNIYIIEYNIIVYVYTLLYTVYNCIYGLQAEEGRKLHRAKWLDIVGPGEALGLLSWPGQCRAIVSINTWNTYAHIYIYIYIITHIYIYDHIYIYIILYYIHLYMSRYMSTHAQTGARAYIYSKTSVTWFPAAPCFFNPKCRTTTVTSSSPYKINLKRSFAPLI